MSRELGQESQRHLVVPDLHGEIELGKRAVDLAASLDAAPVFLGDLIGRGGPAVRETVELAKTEGTAIMGNHELLFLNTLVAIKKEAKLTPKAIKSVSDMAADYGIDAGGGIKEKSEELAQAMTEDGHLEWMEGLEPFFESGTFIAVHAGPRLDRPWRSQRGKIIKQAKPNKNVASGPIQITDQNHELSGALDVPASVDERVFISGHWHRGNPASQRTAKRRVYLTSRLGRDPLYVWDSQDNQILEIPTEPPAQIVVPKDIPKAA